MCVCVCVCERKKEREKRQKVCVRERKREKRDRREYAAHKLIYLHTNYPYTRERECVRMSGCTRWR